jgi:RNA polymerase sigma factor (sigma-70 family)
MEQMEALVRAAQDGDAAAYGQLVRQSQDMAYACAYAFLGDFHLAEDVAQESFLDAYRNLLKLREPAAFLGWLRRIVQYHCSRAIRRRRVPVVQLDSLGASSAPDPTPGPDQRAEDLEMQERVLEAVKTLPPAQREATTLFYISGYSQQDIAQFLDVPAATVKSRLHASRQRLKERMIAMVKQTFDEHKLPDDFAGRIVAGVPVLTWGESGNTTYIAAVSAALSVTDRAVDYDSLMVDSGLALRLRYVRRKDGTDWSTVGPVGQFEEEAEAVSWATGCEYPGVQSRDPEERRRRIVAAIDSGYCPTAYIKGDTGVIYGYEDNGGVLLVRCYKLGEGFHRIALAQMLKEWGAGGSPYFLEPRWPPLSPTAALVHGLLMARRNWNRGREAGEKWQPWREAGAWEYCFGDVAWTAWLADLQAAGSLPQEPAAALSRCHRFTVHTLYDARLAAARYLGAHTGLLGDAAAVHLKRAAEIYEKIGTSVRQLRHPGDAIPDARCWTQETLDNEIRTLARAQELDQAGFTEIEQALAKVV